MSEKTFCLFVASKIRCALEKHDEDVKVVDVWSCVDGMEMKVCVNEPENEGGKALQIYKLKITKEVK